MSDDKQRVRESPRRPAAEKFEVDRHTRSRLGTLLKRKRNEPPEIFFLIFNC